MPQEGKGAKKYGRNKKVRTGAMSSYVRGKIDFATYQKQTSSGPKPVLPKAKKDDKG